VDFTEAAVKRQARERGVDTAALDLANRQRRTLDAWRQSVGELAQWLQASPKHGAKRRKLGKDEAPDGSEPTH
jgi:hypothetical protein